MTDTTAPDAITQADDIVTIDEIRAIFSSGTVPMEAAVAIQNATSPAALRAELREIAAHRRLAAHGAGEGLREAVDVKAERFAFEKWWRAWCPDRDMPSVLSHIFDAWLARARTTPPTDAGSTTREGGEGMDWSEAANFVERYDLPDSAIALLAASPASLSGGAEALIENAARALYLAYAQHPEARWDAVDPAMQEGVWRAHIRAIQAGTIRVAPSPEAPANRQEAGKVELPAAIPGHWDTDEAREIAVEYAGRTRESLMHGDKSDLVVANGIFMVDRNDVELIVWQTAAKERIRWLSARLAALTSPKDVKGGGR